MPKQSRLERIKPLLQCPECTGELAFLPHQATCNQCQTEFKINNDKIYFIDVPERDDELDSMKGKLKKLLGKYYYTVGMKILAPVFTSNFVGKLRQHFDPTQQVIVDIGCGNHRLDKNVFGLDMFDYDAVDVVCDLAKFPFKPESVDVFVSNSLIEHVPDPNSLVANLYQSTKPGGGGLHLIPFLFPFHASPYDFQRYTNKGLEVLFGKWRQKQVFGVSGPASLFLVNFIEFLSILFSFGSQQLRALVYLMFCGLLFPIKFLDLLFVPFKSFQTLAPTLLILLKKADEPGN